MSEKTIKYGQVKGDSAILQSIGYYIKHHRLVQNKSQQRLATDAGINRTTLVDVENGKRANMLTIIQLLRALQKLAVLDVFEIEPTISPMMLAEAQQNERKRASKTKITKTKSNW